MVRELQCGNEVFWQKMILPEEDRRCQPYPPPWNSSYRWFRSPNIVDLWHYRARLRNVASPILCGGGG
jgi:hypothetical protein